MTNTPSTAMCLPSKGLTLTELLRALDIMRRRLARGTRGSEGSFAGFDTLDVSGWREGAESPSIVFTARVVSDDAGSQVVSYTASSCAHEHGLCALTGAGEPYISASGITVGLPRMKSHTTANTRRFAIAAPNR